MGNVCKKRLIGIALAVILLLCIWILWANTAPEVTEYEITSRRLPRSFAGFRIAQISDLHNEKFGAGNAKLIELLTLAQPDIIVLTGDLIDSRHTDVETALEFARDAVQIAPVYYVTGNHEARLREYGDLKTGLAEAGVTLLENEKIRITREGAYITLVGIDDPSFREDYLFGDAAAVTGEAIAGLREESDGYTVLLSHRPELFDLYAENGVDLVFSGHAHGGQFRLPIVGGLVAPNQGLFPAYDAGRFDGENTVLLVSRGLGNSIIPVRFNNRPEVVVAELNTAD